MTIKTVKNEGYTVQLVNLKGREWAKVRTLAQVFDLSTEEMREKIARLQQTHEVKALEWGERTILVNVSDFYRALMDCVPVSTQLEKK